MAWRNGPKGSRDGPSGSGGSDVRSSHTSSGNTMLNKKNLYLAGVPRDSAKLHLIYRYFERFGYVEWVDLVIGASTADTNAYRVSFRLGGDAQRALDALPFVEFGLAPPHDFAMLSHEFTDDDFCKLVSERATTNAAGSALVGSASDNGRLTSFHAEHSTDGRLPVSQRATGASSLPTSVPLPRPRPPPPPRDPRTRPAVNDTVRTSGSATAPYDPRARPALTSAGAASSSTDSHSAVVRDDSRREVNALRDDATRQIDVGAASSATTTTSIAIAPRDPLPPFKCAAIRIPLRILRFALRFKNVALNTAGLAQLAWPTEFKAASDVLVLFDTVADAESAIQRFEAENSAGLVFLVADAKIPPVEVVDKMALGPHECDKAPSGRLRATRTIILPVAGSCSSEDLTQLFENFNNSIVRQWLVQDTERGPKKPLGCIEFKTEEDAMKAFEFLHRKRVLGMVLDLTYAQPTPSDTLLVYGAGRQLDDVYATMFKPFGMVSVDNRGLEGARVKFSTAADATRALFSLSKETEGAIQSPPPGLVATFLVAGAESGTSSPVSRAKSHSAAASLPASRNVAPGGSASRESTPPKTLPRGVDLRHQGAAAARKLARESPLRHSPSTDRDSDVAYRAPSGRSTESTRDRHLDSAVADHLPQSDTRAGTASGGGGSSVGWRDSRNRGEAAAPLSQTETSLRDVKRGADREDFVEESARAAKKPRDKTSTAVESSARDSSSAAAASAATAETGWDTTNNPCRLSIKNVETDVNLQPICGNSALLPHIPKRTLYHFRKRLPLTDLNTTLTSIGASLADVCSVSSVVAIGSSLEVIEDMFTRYLLQKDSALVLADEGWTYVFVPPNGHDRAAGVILKQFSVPVASFTNHIYAAPILIVGRFVLE